MKLSVVTLTAMRGDRILRAGMVAGLVFVFIVLSRGLTLAVETAKMPAASAAVSIPVEAKPSASFNAEAATNAYLAQIPPAAKTRSDSYFEGQYWLILWDFLYGAIVSLLLLNLRWSAAMRNLAERITRFKPLQTMAYWVQYLLLTTMLFFPLTVYEEFLREHKYGLATQTFRPWMGDQFKNLLVSLVMGAVLMVVLFGIVRRLPRTWWLWGALAGMVLLVFAIVISPVYIVPRFNKVTRLSDPKVTEPILAMARANGIPARDVYEIDASKQTTRISANVSGFANTMRITINDNLLRRGSAEEIVAVVGHEMGHYVLNHIYKMLMFYLIVTVAGFAFLKWSLQWSLDRWGPRWQLRDTGDVAALPLVVLLGSIFFFVLTPVFNNFIRAQEYEADIFGLNASRQPDGFAQGAIHLAEYRKMSPGPVEEWIFYDHPSGRNRIFAAMRWKAENLKVAGTVPGGQ